MMTACWISINLRRGQTLGGVNLVLNGIRTDSEFGSLQEGRYNRADGYRYIFDSVLKMEASQEEVFEKTALPLIDGVLTGFNATVFAYGVSRHSYVFGQA